MNSRGNRTTWQSLACFDGFGTKLFRDRAVACTNSGEAIQPRTLTASHCQNRYPSPSRRSGQRFLIGPTCFCMFWRGIAALPTKMQIVIAYQGRNRLLEARSAKLHNFRGNTRCKRHSTFPYSSRFLGFRPVAKARTSSAQPSAALQAVWLAMQSTKEAVSKAAFLVPDLAHWLTTSISNTFGARPDLQTFEKGCPSMFRAALFCEYGPLRPVEELTCSRKS